MLNRDLKENDLYYFTYSEYVSKYNKVGDIQEDFYHLGKKFRSIDSFKRIPL